MAFVIFNEVRWFFWGVKWDSMGSMWFAEVQSGLQGFFEVHLGSVRFGEVQCFFLWFNGVLWVQCGSLRFKVVHRGSLRFIWGL